MLTIRMRSYLSSHHIAAAANFARQANRIERAYDGTHTRDVFLEHRGYVVGAILMSVAFLEGAINELFVDALDDHGGNVQSLPPEARTRLTHLWRFGADRMPILGKFQVALAAANEQPFDEGAQPFQDVRVVVKIRNKLVHYEPEFQLAGIALAPIEKAHELDQQLRGRFSINPITGEGNPFWPDKCLSYGCAKWAVQSSVTLASEFFSRLHLTSNFGATVQDSLALD